MPLLLLLHKRLGREKYQKMGWMTIRKTKNTTITNIAGTQNGRSPRKYYFTYNSNCHVGSMLSRCPAAICNGKGMLVGFKLVFRVTADIQATPGQASDGNSVHGALWQITPECEIVLDRYEGFPHHYKKRQVSVIHDELGELDALVYVMVGRSMQAMPTPNYRDVIGHGYREHDISMKQLNMALRDAEREYPREIGDIRKSELDY